MSVRARHRSPYPLPREPVFAGFLRFLTHPRARVAPDDRPWRTMLLLLAAELVLGLSAAFLIAKPVIDALAPPQSEVFDPVDAAGVIALIILAVLIAPPLEEVIFRLPLAPFQPALPLIGGVFGLLFLVAVLADFPLGLKLSLGVLLGAYTALLLVVGAVSLNMRALPHVQRLWATHFRWVVYGTAIVFGLVHVTNWDWQTFGLIEVLAMPAIASSQIIGGFFLAYVRVRLGMVFAIVSHGAFNALVLPIELLI